MRAKLDSRSIRHAAPATGQIDIYDTVLPGFGLRIGQRNRSYFVHRGVRRIFGSVPPPSATPSDVLPDGVYWPADARQRARELLADLEAGKPVERRRRPKTKPETRPAPAPALPTFARRGDAKAREAAWREAQAAAIPDSFLAVAVAYLNDTLKGGGARLANRPELERKLMVGLVSWHLRPIREITRRDIREFVRQKAQTAPVEANRTLSFIKSVFRWAADNDILDADPAARLAKPSEETARSRFMTDDEIRWFWRACDGLAEPAGRLFKLLLVTGQRRGEIAGLRRSELGKLPYQQREAETGREKRVEADAILLPPERVKRRKAHSLPLSPLALSLVQGAPAIEIDGKTTEHLFATTEGGDAPPSGWTKWRGRLDELMGEAMAKDLGEEYDAKRHRVADLHLHDARATVATLMEARLGIPRAVVSRVLGHAEGEGRSTTSRYVRHAYDAEAAAALNRWADELTRIVGLNVVDLKGKTA